MVSRSLVASLFALLLAAPASAQGGFVFSGSLALAPGLQLLAADFAGDQRSELFAYDPATGSLSVGENIGAFFSFSTWATVSPASGWQFEPGDFNYDGATDVLGYFPSNGTLWVGTNTGSGFAFTLWLTVPSTPGNPDLTAGDFDADALADFMGDLGGTLIVGINTAGSSFALDTWASVSPPADWLFVADTFTSDGRADLGGYHPSNGSLWVGRSTGSSFVFEPWGELQSGGWQITRLASGDVDGDDHPDLIAYDAVQGEIVAALHAGSSFVPRRWAAGVSSAFSSFVAGDFAGNSLPDVVGYDAATGAIWVGENVPTCSNGLDDDGDGLADTADPGCTDATDDSETNPAQPCDDGEDNDGDDLVDESQDPGCFSLTYGVENPACDDGEDNDLDGAIDMADAQCNEPYRENETPDGSCGLGGELVLAVAGIRALLGRRRSHKLVMLIPLCLLGTFLADDAGAADGQIEINQAIAPPELPLEGRRSSSPTSAS